MPRPFVLIFTVAAATAALTLTGSAQPRMEDLSRGLVGVHQPDGKVFLSWRLLGTDEDNIAFNVYRETIYPEGEQPIDFGIYASRLDIQPGTVKLNDQPITDVTWFIDNHPGLHRSTSYFVRSVIDGSEGEPSKAFSFDPGAPPLPYHSIPLQTPEGYTPGDGSVGDLDGDGDYEIIVMQNGRARDNAHNGITDPPILQAYKMDGTLLWEINLGRNIRAGAHYTQFMVYDFNGNGRAEIAMKTADGTADGLGRVIGDPDANYVNERGHILAGPEFLTIFDGLTGEALSTVDYIPARHPTELHPTSEQLSVIWGDGRGNRSDRYLAGVAYLDGERPSLIMARGYYTRSVIAAWDFRGGELTSRWVFDSHDGTPGNRAYAGQGNHSLSIADVDGDGRDEIIYGAMTVNSDGTGRYSTRHGHGDALHVGNLDPRRPGLEVMEPLESPRSNGGIGLAVRDAATGETIFTVPSRNDVGRGVSFNIDPRFSGNEVWALDEDIPLMYTIDGEVIMERPADLPANFAVWWDGDLLRELLDQNFISKWNWEKQKPETLLVAHDCISSNGTKATPLLSGDVWGDWREEVIWRTRDGRELRIYTSTIPTEYRMNTLMHDPQYRTAIAWQNVAYNQPPHPSFHLDSNHPLPERRPVRVIPRAQGK
jgi:rhamnogalacturonan endolyase